MKLSKTQLKKLLKYVAAGGTGVSASLYPLQALGLIDAEKLPMVGQFVSALAAIFGATLS